MSADPTKFIRRIPEELTLLVMSFILPEVIRSTDIPSEGTRKRIIQSYQYIVGPGGNPMYSEVRLYCKMNSGNKMATLHDAITLDYISLARYIFGRTQFDFIAAERVRLAVLNSSLRIFNDVIDKFGPPSLPHEEILNHLLIYDNRDVFVRVLMMKPGYGKDLIRNFFTRSLRWKSRKITTFMIEHYPSETKEYVLENASLMCLVVDDIKLLETFLSWGADPLAGWRVGNKSSLLYCAITLGSFAVVDLILSYCTGRVKLRDLLTVAEKDKSNGMYQHLLG